jgi:NAD(P)-dependent dehydrogenase (short-subunit alcohol dehydrogenase family)
MRGLTGKIALVTGGGNGIGRAIALRLAEEGADVALIDINAAALDDTAGAIRKLGRRAEGECADVGDRDAASRAAVALTQRLGPIDVLVNNAGIVRLASVLDTRLELWREITRVNVEGTLNLLQLVVPGMVERGAGAVVNVASWHGKSARPFFGAYSASKAAVIALTQSLAQELGPQGVRVNAVCPGMIEGTPMRQSAEAQSKALGVPAAKDRLQTIPLRRAGSPEDVAKVVAFLASDEAGYMTGQALNITGGLWQH